MLTMKERRVLTKCFVSHYRKKVKGHLLSEFIEMTDFHGSYAAYLLRHHSKRSRLSQRLVMGGGELKKDHRQRARKYVEKALQALKVTWDMLDICVANVWPPSYRRSSLF